jgi:hypothetical protein
VKVESGEQQWSQYHKNATFHDPMTFFQRGSMSGPQQLPPSQPMSASETQSSVFSNRSLRQLGLFFGGAAFFGLASVITRRSLVRRYKATVPKFFQQSNRPNGKVDGAIEAFEALTIATVNVFSLSIMFTGGMLWAFDISSLEDMRRKLRGGLGIGGEGRENAAEEEMEEWLATVLARKDEKERQKNTTKDESGR